MVTTGIDNTWTHYWSVLGFSFSYVGHALMSLVSQYKLLILSAMRRGEYEKAQELREWAYLQYDLDLREYLFHPALGKPKH